MIWKTAYIMHGDMNVAVGPKKEQLEECPGSTCWHVTCHVSGLDYLIGFRSVSAYSRLLGGVY